MLISFNQVFRFSIISHLPSIIHNGCGFWLRCFTWYNGGGESTGHRHFVAEIAVIPGTLGQSTPNNKLTPSARYVCEPSPGVFSQSGSWCDFITLSGIRWEVLWGVCCTIMRERSKPETEVAPTNMFQASVHPSDKVRDAPLSKKCSFFEHCSKGLWPPPLLFEHLSYFAGGVFWTRFWAFDIMYLFYPQISPSMPQKSLFMQISCC